MRGKNDCIEFVNKNYKDSIELLEEIANYGDELIAKVSKTTDNVELELVILHVFLRNMVIQSAAVCELCRAGLVESSKANFRVSLESWFQLEWILSCDTDNRVTYFFVYSILKKIEDLKLQIGLDVDGVKVNIYRDLGIENDKDALNKELSSFEKMISEGKRRDVASEFKSKNYKKWFQALGVGSLRDIAEQINAKYDYFHAYSYLSKSIHTSILDPFCVISAGKAKILPQWHALNIDDVLGSCCMLLVRAYHSVLSTCFESELSAFASKHKNDWYDRILNIPELKHIG